MKEDMDDKKKYELFEELIQELYLERNLLTVTLANLLLSNESINVYKTRKDFDGVEDKDYFILMFYSAEEKKQFSYHVPIKYWEYVVDVPEKERNSQYDGGTKLDSINNLKYFAEKILPKKV